MRSTWRSTSSGPTRTCSTTSTRALGSYFDNSELKATGLPHGRELEILKEVKAEVPPEVFTAEWKNPVNVTPQDARKHLGEAAKLLAEAGWTPKNGVLTNAKGEELTAEFLLVQPDFERIVLPYKAVLDKLGIKASLRIVDTSQYQRRHDTFDFDIIVASFPQSESPGNEQRDFWGSDAADKEGSRNVIGIKNPAVDKLIDKIIMAKDRDDLVAATRALDRVLLWNHYVVPQLHTPFERLAIWDMYRRPDKLPSRNSSLLAGVVVRRSGGQAARRCAGLDHLAARPDDARLRESNAHAHLEAGAGVGRSSPRLGRRRRRQRQAWPVGLRRAQVPGRLQAFRMGQSRRAEGRPPVHDRHRRPHHLRQLQRLHPEGRRGAGARATSSTR